MASRSPRATTTPKILWGDHPRRTRSTEDIQRLIARLYAELRRYPTVAEIGEHILRPHHRAGDRRAPSANAARVFREDVGRGPIPR